MFVARECGCPPSVLAKSNVRATRPALTLLVDDDLYHFWNRKLEAGYLLRAPIASVPCGLKLKGRKSGRPVTVLDPALSPVFSHRRAFPRTGVPFSVVFD